MQFPRGSEAERYLSRWGNAPALYAKAYEQDSRDRLSSPLKYAKGSEAYRYAARWCL